MKKVLIVGFGNHAQRRILPALKSINQIDDIVVTSRSNKKNYTDEIVYLNKNDILNSDIFFDAVIISSYPNVHIDNLKEFKNKSNTFLIEKPVTNYLEYLESSEYLGFHNNYAARECLMYFHHPIYRKFQEIINSDKIEAISASFQIPHIENNNFRYSKALGGSAILDQGVYPISLILENFKLIDNSIDSSIDIQDNQSIDSSGYLSCKSEGGVEININWGIGFEYSNFVEVISKGIIYSFPMFFSLVLGGGGGATFGTGVDPTLKEHHTKNIKSLQNACWSKLNAGGRWSKCVSENDLPFKMNCSKIFVTI